MKSYTSTTFGFSIRYPADWRVNEMSNSVAFNSSTELTSAQIGIVHNWSGDEQALVSIFVSTMRQNDMFKNLTIDSQSDRTFNGVIWRYLKLTSTYSGSTIKWDMYFNIHEGTGYVFTGFASSADYSKRTQTFTEMMESFRFLP